MRALVHRMINIQQARGLTDTQFAASLNISVPTWNRIRHGRSQPGLKTIMAAVQAYPELINSVVSALSATKGA